MRILIISLLILLPAPGFGQSVVIDGRFDDWENVKVAYADPSNDGGSSGIDFGGLRIVHDEKRVFLHVELGTDILVQDGNTMRLYIDTDLDAGTGLQVAGIGAELIWNFANRNGQVRLDGNTRSVNHADVGLILSPSMTTSQMEMSFSRDAVIGGKQLFPTERMRVVLRVSEPNGDQLPDQDGGMGHDLADTGQPFPPPMTIEQAEQGSARILTWNTLHEGLLDSQRQPAFRRILRALQPDVMCFQECFDASAGQVLVFVRSVLDPPPGRSWRTLKIDQGNVLVTHFDIDDNWEVQSGYRESAYLLRSPQDEMLLLLNCHLRCCDANEKRQLEADGVIAFLRDAKTAGGRLTLDEGTPIMLVGDLNLVGDRRQYETLITGDIADNARYGADAAPGWNDTPFTDLVSRSPRSPFAFTWYDTGSSYFPARLDYMFYTASSLEITADLIVNTADMSAAERLHLGVEEDDSYSASDHLPRYADIRWKQSTSVAAAPEAGFIVSSIWPQPAVDALHIELSAVRQRLHLRLYDLLGRQLRSEFKDPAGTAHTMTLDLSALRAGMYVLRIDNGRHSYTRTFVVR